MPLLKMFLIALIFAGGVGNITDRILFDRHVTDFMITELKILEPEFSTSLMFVLQAAQQGLYYLI